MNDDIYNPEFLAELEKETEFVNNSGSKKYASRFVLKDAGESALGRFLPFAFDAKGRWYARVARHWVNNRAYLCTRDTAVEHGGDPKGHCHICDAVDDFNRSRDKKVSDAAYKLTSVTQWCTAFKVWEQFDSKDRKIQHEPKAQEFWHYKDAFADILGMYKKFMRRVDSPLSILDPQLGCDVFVTKARRGYRFDREDPNPISKTPAETLKKWLTAIEFKPEKELVGDDLDELIAKIEDACLGKSSSSRGRSKSSRIDEDDEDDDDDRGSSRRSASRDDEPDDRSSRRSSSRDDEPRSRRSEPEPETRSKRSTEDEPRSRRSEPDDEPRSRRSEPEDEPRSRRSTVDDPRSRRSEPEHESRSRRDPDPEPETRSRRSTEDEPRSRRGEPEGRTRRDPEESRAPAEESRTRRDPDARADTSRGRHVDLEEGEPAGAEADEGPPTPLRDSGRRGAPPPPAAGRGRRTAGEVDDDEDPLPEGDKEKVPPAEPKAGEVEERKAEARTPAAPSSFKDELAASLRRRVAATDGKS